LIPQSAYGDRSLPIRVQRVIRVGTLVSALSATARAAKGT